MPDLTLTDIERIEAAADKATPGPWIDDGTGCVSAYAGKRTIAIPGDRVFSPALADVADAAHIANCDPATVKALCAAWRELESLKPKPQDGTESLTHISGHHFRRECKHGRVQSQCRCPGKKRVEIVPCVDPQCGQEPPKETK